MAQELVNLIDQRHELVRLAALIDWDAFSQFTSTTGPGVAYAADGVAAVAGVI